MGLRARALWDIPNLLWPMFSERVINSIMRQLEEGGHAVYHVTVEHRFNEGEIVSVEILDDIPLTAHARLLNLYLS
jgi:hypothetical protein